MFTLQGIPQKPNSSNWNLYVPKFLTNVKHSLMKP